MLAHTNRIQSNPVQKRQTTRQRIQLIRQHRPTHFDHGKFLRFDTGKVANVLLNLFARANVVQELDNGVLIKHGVHISK